MVSRSDGSKITLRMSSAPVKDTYGNLLFVVATMEDMAADTLRANTEKFVLNIQPINLMGIMERLIQELQPQISARKLNFEKEFDANLPMVSTDANLIAVIIQNLLTNAIKYTPDGGTIHFSIAKNGENVFMVLRDSGYGIPTTAQQFIFKKMYRADNILKYQPEGSGMGLYLVKSIIDQIGGTIHFESTEGMGTTFYVTIPIVANK